jgi:hypothetical protein
MKLKIQGILSKCTLVNVVQNFARNTMNILIQVDGSGVTVAEVVGGQIKAASFAAENSSRPTLRTLIQKYWGNDNKVIVEDCEFGTGYHTVTTHSGANGVGWGYRLIPILSWKEAVDIHDENVNRAQKGWKVGKSPLELVFDR